MVMPKITILQTVLDRLREISNTCSGDIYSIIYNNTILIVGVCFDNQLEYNNPDELRLVCQNSYPVGIDWCGLFKIEDKDYESNGKTIEKLKDVPVTNNPILIHKNILNSQLLISALHNERLCPVDYNIMQEDELKDIFVHLRIKSQLTLSIDDQSINSVIDSLNSTCKKYSSGFAMFHCLQTDIYLHPNTIDTISSQLNISNIFELIKKPVDTKNIEQQGLLEFDLFCLTSTEKNSDTMTITQTTGSLSKLLVHLPVDVLCIVNKNRLIQDCYGILTDALCRWFDLIRMYYENYSSNNWKTETFKIFHFFPKPLEHYITAVLAANSTDEVSVERRKQLHLLFNLSFSRPYFCLANVVEFGIKDVLLNVHRGVRHTRVPDGRISLVNGNYGYFHYLQKCYDDSGWGCAYRSFQTIFSWFKFQGYTMKEVPLHKEIQECLVKIGDKPPTFIGSKSWIGSTELSFCLSEMLNIESVILNVSRGEELITLGLQLEYHFRTAGTPVMIGGGNLAHTILGIDFNEITGNIKFLVLDPHYISPIPDTEDLNHIRNKGGVFWTGLEFWSKKNFYNLCLPQPVSHF